MLYLADINEIWYLPTSFIRNLWYKFSQRSLLLVSCPWMTTDRCDRASGRFSQLIFGSTKKTVGNYSVICL